MNNEKKILKKIVINPTPYSTETFTTSLNIYSKNKSFYSSRLSYSRRSQFYKNFVPKNF